MLCFGYMPLACRLTIFEVGFGDGLLFIRLSLSWEGSLEVLSSLSVPMAWGGGQFLDVYFSKTSQFCSSLSFPVHLSSYQLFT